MKIKLVARNINLKNAWEEEFKNYNNVEIIHDDIFNQTADAIISPANSFGIMDGGLDGKLRDFFGMEVEYRVRNKIDELFFGEMPVGCALTVETGDKSFPYMISAPTMRVPEDVSTSLNAYFAMKAIIIEATKNNFESIAVPGLCSLSGRMPFDIVARQMRVAVDKLLNKSIKYSHWREEKALQEYMMCKTNFLPYDYELKY